MSGRPSRHACHAAQTALNKARRLCIAAFIAGALLVPAHINALTLTQTELDASAPRDPAAGPWLERSDRYFRFVYKQADAALVEELLAVSRGTFQTVTGFFGCLPEEKPVVIIYGAMDSPPFGGVTAPLPMRIGLTAASLRLYPPQSILVHEFTHYMQASTKKSSWIGRVTEPFCPELRKAYSLSFSDLSIEGSTSFMDGVRRMEYASLPVRAAVLEGQMWNYDQVSTGALRQPANLRVYLSGMLIQDWLYDTRGEDAFARMLDKRDGSALPFDSLAFKESTGLDFKTAWGDIRSGLEEKYAFARALPRGMDCTPRDSQGEPQWYALKPSGKGFLQYRRSLDKVSVLGFWQPQKSGADSFIPLEGLISDDFSVDAEGSLVAAVLNEPEDTALWQDVNRNRLILAGVEWSGGNERAAARDIRVLPGDGFSQPCLSPDGKRLFAVRRDSGWYNAVEYNVEAGTLRMLGIPGGFCVSELAISPDGKRLAIGFVNAGKYDVGVYDLDHDAFTALTDDEAQDFAPRFLSDGSFVFSSDRENTVAVYRHENGVFSRECIESVAAINPVEDGRGGYYYSSVSAFGWVIRHLDAAALKKEPVPAFLEMRPDWIRRRDSLWETYGKKGAALEQKSGGGGQTPPQAAIPFLDIALPRAWYPVASYGPEGWGAGIAVIGTSFLEENGFAAAALYQPEAGQVSGSASFSLALPFMSAEVDFSQRYFSTGDGSGAVICTLMRSYALGADFPLIFNAGADRVYGALSASAGIELDERIQRPASFNLIDSFSLEPQRNLTAVSGLKGGIYWPSPRDVLFGGSYINARARGLVEWTAMPGNPSFGAIAGMNAGLLLGSELLQVKLTGAWREAGGAHYLIPRAVAGWEGSSLAPLYAETGFEWATSYLEKESTEYFLLLEQIGMTAGVKTFWEADPAASSARWVPELEVYCDYTARLVFYYTPIDVKLGVGYRIPVDPALGPVFDPQNIYYRMTVGGISLSP